MFLSSCPGVEGTWSLHKLFQGWGFIHPARPLGHRKRHHNISISPSGQCICIPRCFCWFFVFKQGFYHVTLLCVNNVNITCFPDCLFPGLSVPWTEGVLLALVTLLTVQSLRQHSVSYACLWSLPSFTFYSVGNRIVAPLPSPSLFLLGCLGRGPQGTCHLSVCSGPWRRLLWARGQRVRVTGTSYGRPRW